MYLPVTPKRTCAAAWLEATSTVNGKPRHEAHNVIVGVAEPLSETETDSRVVDIVDSFLRNAQGAMPIQSVANTIFPERLYRHYGTPALYEVYGKIYERIRKPTDWGRYFERMIHRPLRDGKSINPLEKLVEKMRQHVHGGHRTFRNVYEMAIYDLETDAGRVMNRQCLSFLSFKLDQNNQLLLTALYRNHYYVGRLLGNLIGLARLMAFVGKEAEVGVGALTVVSTHAIVDTPSGHRRQGVEELLSICAAVGHTAGGRSMRTCGCAGQTVQFGHS